MPTIFDGSSPTEPRNSIAKRIAACAWRLRRAMAEEWGSLNEARLADD
jgi:hypothetical protein